jgi:hypothetical protein
MVQIVWLTNKAGNTGEDGGLPQVLFQALDDESSIIEKGATMTTLKSWCATNGYIEYPTNLCAVFGQHLKLYGAPWKFSKEHCGKNNIIATYFACDHITGLSPNTVIGKAVLVRLDGPNGEPVDLTREEVIRTGFFLNDLMDSYGDGPRTPQELQNVFQAWKRCFPYYDSVNNGDFMGASSMNGQNGRWMSGITGVQENNNVACTFDIVSSFRIE